MSHQIQTDRFPENSRRALANPQLQKALTIATAKFTMARGAAVSDVGEEWEDLRNRARQIKEHAIANLDRYLEEFSNNVERLGGHVLWARDADEANDIIRNLAVSNGVTLAVKSKSMMTEEIELNHALAAAGVEAIETDLGEYIVQLAGERPSHIIAPAIHKTRSEIADLFTEKLRVERTEEIEKMTALARNVLRQRFAQAGMGITGANFAVAETGTIVLVENEGNIRLTNSLPRIHVALMGIEKVIPRLMDLSIFLRLLPRSASGQKMSSYVSFLTGVKQRPEQEGPEQLYVVILDNGRSEALANTHLRESLYCIRCGACLNACPVYQKIGGHAYGWIYPGPIGAVLTPQLVGRELAADLPFASSLCGACREVCPIKINIPDMLLELRQEIKEKSPHHLDAQDAGTGMKPAARRSHGGEERQTIGTFKAFSRKIENIAEKIMFKLWAVAMATPANYRRATRFGRLVSQSFGSEGQGLPVNRWTATRDLPPIAERSFKEQWAEISASAKRVK
jgi:L-lactate dehydrogenase complex protein LldF